MGRGLWLAVPGLAAFIAVVSGCGGDSGNVTVPRPRAYPRLVATDSAYIKVEGAPHGFEANLSAIVSREDNDGPGEWYTVTYPLYGAEIYFTFTPADSANYERVIENRLQRISLNFGETPFSTRSLSTPSGWEGAVFSTREGVALPVQFILTSSGTVVSGSMFFPAYAENPDSLRPAVETVERDIVHTLLNIR